MKKILIVNPYYYPGYRSGGPQQTFMNIIDVFGAEYEFYVLTLNHDLGEGTPYTDILPEWNNVGKARVKYISEQELTIGIISKYAAGMDLVFAGGMFEKTTILVMIAKRLKKISCDVFVAPMGVFSDGAMGHKTAKKKIFLFFVRFFSLFKEIKWSFTSEMELEDFTKYLGVPKVYQIANDLPRKPSSGFEMRKNARLPLKILFLSRICSQKNLLFAIKILSKIKGHIQFDIYGIQEDQKYWEKCVEELHKLPKNISWNYKGAVSSTDVTRVMSPYHVFLLPTLGENFGHVIYEALSVGCVPIISNTTPWNELAEEKCGRVIDLQDMQGFCDAVNSVLELSEEDYNTLSKRCIAYANRKYEEFVTNSGYKKIFD